MFIIEKRKARKGSGKEQRRQRQRQRHRNKIIEKRIEPKLAHYQKFRNMKMQTKAFRKILEVHWMKWIRLLRIFGFHFKRRKAKVERERER